MKLGLLLLLLLPIVYSQSAAVASILDKSVTNWNSFFGANVELLSWNYYHTIVDESDRISHKLSLFSPHTTYYLTGDLGTPSTVSMDKIANHPDFNSQEWDDYIDGLLVVGQDLMEIHWKFIGSGNTFTTAAVGDSSSFVFESIISNAIRNVDEPESRRFFGSVSTWSQSL
eukprot:UN22233